ncbi:uncharacterized protein TNCV_4930201 [Trichonephila clavipes]|nr:uncharacterized protein TNCV_4930201 [Trichonephila clavipes]
MIELKKTGWLIHQISADTHLDASMGLQLRQWWLEIGNTARLRTGMHELKPPPKRTCSLAIHFCLHVATQNETHQEQLSEYLLNLDANQIELQTLNKEIENLLLDKELFEAEIEGSLEYEENINEVRYKIESKINKIHLSQQVVNSKGANESNVRTNNSAFSLNLPKLRIPNFSGDSTALIS